MLIAVRIDHLACSIGDVVIYPQLELPDGPPHSLYSHFHSNFLQSVVKFAGAPAVNCLGILPAPMLGKDPGNLDWPGDSEAREASSSSSLRSAGRARKGAINRDKLNKPATSVVKRLAGLLHELHERVPLVRQCDDAGGGACPPRRHAE
jgi:hypothetical protein